MIIAIMGDIHILSGISEIVNVENIRPGVDLRELEQKMISGGLIQKTRDPQDKFNEELRNTAAKLGINFESFGTTSGAAMPDDESSSSDESSSDDEEDEPAPQPSYDAPRPATPPHDSGRDSAGYSRDSAGYSRDSATYVARDSAGYGRDGGTAPFKFGTGYRSPSAPPISDPSLREKTIEQERRSHINMVNQEMGVQSIGFSFEKEKREDIKLQMLDEISSLMTTLQEEDVDLSRIPQVDARSSYEDVESVLKILRHKNDRSRYCSLAEEFAIFGAYLLEDLFDGKKMWFGRYRPDLVGWHNQVNCKLRRMRHETSQLMGSIMQDNNIGDWTRILLELVPNAILYSRMRKQQYGQETIYNDPTFVRPTDSEMSRMNNRLRDIGPKLE